MKRLSLPLMLFVYLILALLLCSTNVIAASVDSPIVGAWNFFSNEYGALVFYENGEYLVYDSSNVEGVEYGNYTHDNESHEFSINVVKDENDAAGLADNGVPTVDEVYVEDDTIHVIAPDGEESTAPRVRSTSSDDGSDSSGGGGGGCVMTPNSSNGMSWLLLLTIPAIMIIRRVRV